MVGRLPVARCRVRRGGDSSAEPKLCLSALAQVHLPESNLSRPSLFTPTDLAHRPRQSSPGEPCLALSAVASPPMRTARLVALPQSTDAPPHLRGRAPCRRLVPRALAGLISSCALADVSSPAHPRRLGQRQGGIPSCAFHACRLACPTCASMHLRAHLLAPSSWLRSSPLAGPRLKCLAQPSPRTSPVASRSTSFPIPTMGARRSSM